MSLLIFTLTTWTGVLATMVALGLVYVGAERVARQANCNTNRGDGPQLPTGRTHRVGALV